MRGANGDSVTITFRLLRSEFERLRDDAAKSDQSPGQRARRLVRDGLKESPQDELVSRLERMIAKADFLIEMLEASTQVLLTHGGRLSVEDAKEWVTKSFR
jgi:hypothetical protein